MGTSRLDSAATPGLETEEIAKFLGACAAKLQSIEAAEVLVTEVVTGEVEVRRAANWCERHVMAVIAAKERDDLVPSRVA